MLGFTQKLSVLYAVIKSNFYVKIIQFVLLTLVQPNSIGPHPHSVMALCGSTPKLQSQIAYNTSKLRISEGITDIEKECLTSSEPR